MDTSANASATSGIGSTGTNQQQQQAVDLSADEELAKKMQEQLTNEAEMAAEMDEVSSLSLSLSL
jgi:hypothetical protein